MFLVLAVEELALGTISMSVFGGLALFLFGMEQMTDALKMVAGDGLKNLLAKLTTNRWTGLLAGTLVTAVIQSSSVTTVLVVGFISAGLMSLAQSIPVILGADIGTTITAQIVAFKVTHYALILVSVGFALLFLTKHEKLRHYGHMVMGLGLIFFGMQLMSDGTAPLRSYTPFIEAMQKMENPLMGILAAAAFTAIVQSSSATMGIVIVLASQGLITLEAGIALAFGANIGTCVTALLASIGKPREAVQAAMVHIIFKILGVVIWFAFIDQLAALVTWVSPAHANLTGPARLAAETPRQIANAHTVFNVANAFLFIWFTKPMASLVRFLVPKRAVTGPEVIRPKYLDDLLLQTPALALDIVRMELGRLGACVVDMVRRALTPVIRGTQQDLASLETKDDDVDRLHGALITYLARLSQESLSKHQLGVLHDYMAATNYLENIGDMVETNLVSAGSERLGHNLQISEPTQNVLKSLHDKVVWSVERAVQALVEADRAKAEEVIDAKDEINGLANDAETHVSRRLAADEPNRLLAFRIESEMVEYLKRVYYFAKRIAKVVSDVEQVSSEGEPAAQQQPQEATV